MINASRKRKLNYIQECKTPKNSKILCIHSHTLVKLYTTKNASFITKKSPNDIITKNEIRLYKIINDLVYSGKSPFFFVSVKPPKFEKYTITQYIETSNRNVGLLWDFLSKPRSISVRKSLTFQILHALGWLRLTGVQHGDLHFDNIFVVRSKKKFLDLETPNSKHRVPTHGYEIRIFDFDRSFKKSTPQYPWSIPSKLYHPKFDYFKFMVYAQYPDISGHQSYRLWSLLPPHTARRVNNGYEIKIGNSIIQHPFAHPPKKVIGSPFNTIRKWFRVGN